MKIENLNRFQNLSDRFKSIPTPLFYSIHLNIAVDEWQKELNKMSAGRPSFVINSSGGETFLINTPNGYVKNQRLIDESIKQAEESGLCRRFHFFYNVKVLRRLKDELLKQVNSAK